MKSSSDKTITSDGVSQAAGFDHEERPDRRREIRDKARAIFLRYGYRKTTIEDIGKACGLGKAALYHYFSSKEEIFAEVVRAESATVLAQIRAATAAADDPKAKFAAMIRTRLQIIGGQIREVFETEVFSEIAELMPLVARARQQYLDEEASILKKIVEEGERLGVFKPVNASSVALLVISAIRGLELHLAEIQNAPSFEGAIESMLDLFLEGIVQHRTK